jgi:CubicO group peptidase (beta-lactamase class C family)
MTARLAKQGPDRRHRCYCSLLAATVAIPAVGAGQQSPAGDPNSRLIAALEDFIPQVLRIHGVPGLNLAIARGGKVIWEKGFGYANLERRVPMTPATVMHSGSMGKTYTATAVMQLVERGVVELDAPVNRYFKEFQITNPLGGRDITVRDFLTHRAGLSQNDAHSVFDTPKPLAQHVPESYRRTHFKPYRGLAPMWISNPGEKYTYSNLGIATLGYLVEVTNPEKLSFSAYVQKHIIDPLGMRSSQFPAVQDSAHIRPDIWARMSTGYSGIGALRVATPTIYFGDYPAGTVVTTPGDHIRILLAYMNGGQLDGYQLLRPETVKEMLTPQVPAAGEASVGLVWGLRDVGKETMSFSHSGAHMWGWTNNYIGFPALELALAISMNRWSIQNEAATRLREATLITEFVRSWVVRERAGTLVIPPTRSWAWKLSYIAGMMVVERINGTLGIDEPISAAKIEAMVRSADVQAELGPGDRVWDADGFRAGIRDLTPVEMRPASIAAFIRSGRAQVMPEELPLIYLELGGRGGLPDVTK